MSVGGSDEIFELIDADGNGCLSLDEAIEFGKCLGGRAGESTIKELFDIADADGDGSIDRNEFSSLINMIASRVGMDVSDMHTTFSKWCFEQLFDLVDNDGGGTVTGDELLKLTTTLSSLKHITHEDVRKSKDHLGIKVTEMNKSQFGEVVAHLTKGLPVSRVLRAFSSDELHRKRTVSAFTGFFAAAGVAHFLKKRLPDVRAVEQQQEQKHGELLRSHSLNSDILSAGVGSTREMMRKYQPSSPAHSKTTTEVGSDNRLVSNSSFLQPTSPVLIQQVVSPTASPTSSGRDDSPIRRQFPVGSGDHSPAPPPRNDKKEVFPHVSEKRERFSNTTEQLRPTRSSPLLLPRSSPETRSSLSPLQSSIRSKSPASLSRVVPMSDRRAMFIDKSDTPGSSLKVPQRRRAATQFSKKVPPTTRSVTPPSSSERLSSTAPSPSVKVESPVRGVPSVRVDSPAAQITQSIPQVSEPPVQMTVDSPAAQITQGVPQVSEPPVQMTVESPAAQITQGVPQVDEPPVQMTVESTVPTVTVASPAAQITQSVPQVSEPPVQMTVESPAAQSVPLSQAGSSVPPVTVESPVPTVTIESPIKASPSPVSVPVASVELPREEGSLSLSPAPRVNHKNASTPADTKSQSAALYIKPLPQMRGPDRNERCCNWLRETLSPHGTVIAIVSDLVEGHARVIMSSAAEADVIANAGIKTFKGDRPMDIKLLCDVNFGTEQGELEDIGEEYVEEADHDDALSFSLSPFRRSREDNPDAEPLDTMAVKHSLGRGHFPCEDKTSPGLCVMPPWTDDPSIVVPPWSDDLPQQPVPPGIDPDAADFIDIPVPSPRHFEKQPPPSLQPDDKRSSWIRSTLNYGLRTMLDKRRKDMNGIKILQGSVRGRSNGFSGIEVLRVSAGLDELPIAPATPPRDMSPKKTPIRKRVFRRSLAEKKERCSKIESAAKIFAQANTPSSVKSTTLDMKHAPTVRHAHCPPVYKKIVSLENSHNQNPLDPMIESRYIGLVMNVAEESKQKALERSENLLKGTPSPQRQRWTEPNELSPDEQSTYADYVRNESGRRHPSVVVGSNVYNSSRAQSKQQRKEVSTHEMDEPILVETTQRREESISGQTASPVAVEDEIVSDNFCRGEYAFREPPIANGEIDWESLDAIEKEISRQTTFLRAHAALPEEDEVITEQNDTDTDLDRLQRLNNDADSREVKRRLTRDHMTIDLMLNQINSVIGRS